MNNNHLKEFILNYFFVSKEIVGWKNIGEALITNGTCIVAGDGNLWVGGIGNFIKKEKAEDLIDCTRLVFNLDEFICSEYYKDVLNEYLKELENNLVKLNKSTLTLNKLTDDLKLKIKILEETIK